MREAGVHTADKIAHFGYISTGDGSSSREGGCGL